MKKILRDYYILFLISTGIVIVDQFTKGYIRSTIPFGEIWSPWEWLTPIARIVHWTNSGVAFGMFQGQGYLFTVLAILVSLVIVFYFPRIPKEDKILRFALCLQLGGAIGNLVDRLFFGEVTDFISIGNFPVFNIADASITTGVAVLILGIWIQEKNENNQVKNQTSLDANQIPSEGDDLR